MESIVKKLIFQLLGLGLVPGFFISTSTVFAEVPSKLEPDYAEAVLAYNAKDYQKAVKLIQEIHKKSPDIPEVLELEALSHKSLKNESGMEQVYQRLIAVKTQADASASELAPYHFELGLLRHQEKRLEDARKHFQYALENGFNEGVSHLYLGMYTFQSGAWAESEGHFRGVVSSSASDLKPAAYFYLGQAYGKMEYPAGATQSFISAKSTAKAVLDDPESSAEAKKIAQQIYDATEKALAPFDHGQYFGSAGYLAGYDSNLLAIPSTTSVTETSGKSSMTNAFLVGIGYTTSPLRWIQFVPSYRGSFNFNTNRDSASAEFPTHTAAFYTTANPLSRFSYGLKLESSLVFQNGATSSTGRFKYSLYSRSAMVGPYFKYEIKPKLVVGLDFSWQPRSFSNDGSDALKRSGQVNYFKLFLKNDRGHRFFNPTVALKHEDDQAAGRDYKYEQGGVEFSNMLHWNDQTSLALTLNFSETKYNDRTGGFRKDDLASLDLSVSRRINPRWMVMGSALMVKNNSTIPDSYSYSRAALSVGASYSLF